MYDSFVIGVDYGTDSVRAVLVNTKSGKIVANKVCYYKRWKSEKFCDPYKNQFRQHPLDYIEGLKTVVTECVKSVKPAVAANIKGISFDTTGSTICPVNKEGTPLSLTKGFENNPNAMFILWKDHTAVKEADEINKVAHNWGGTDYTQFVGGIYSSEWFLSKVLYILRNDEKVKKAAYSWVEHCDWIPSVLTEVKDASCIKRSRCAAGHKLMWHKDYKGLPSEEFLSKIDPLLSGLRDKLFSETYTSDKAAGVMTDKWAKILHLPKGVVVGIGAFDCHMGAVGAQVEPYSLVKIIGTSTCDILIAPKEDIGNKLISGICGQVDGSVEPNMIGMEAGQSSFGDVYAWFKKVLMWSVNNGIQKTSVLNAKKKKDLIEEISDSLLVELEKQTLKTPISKNSLTAIDWFNGRRTPNANQLLKGAIIGLTLASDALRIYRSLVESTAFGAKKIVDCFVNQGIAINSVVAIGGIAQKSKFVMQTLSDVLNMPIKVVKSDQACALGAAMFASIAAGVNTIEQAKKNMGSGFSAQFNPIKENVEIYKNLYDKYQKFGDYIEVECKN